MLLAAVGFDASRYTGAGWAARVNADAEENGVYHSFTGQYDEPVTRDDACLLIYNAMQCPATDGTARYVLDELMNPKTRRQRRNRRRQALCCHRSRLGRSAGRLAPLSGRNGNLQPRLC